MRTHTSDFKNKIKLLGRQIKSKIIYYNSYNLISENDDNILSENNIQLITEQANYSDPIEIAESDIFSISINKNGNLLQSLSKELDFETKIELNIGTVVNPQFALLISDNQYEYLNYGNYIIYSKEYKFETQTWQYVCYDKMLFSMVKYRGLNNVTYPITIKQYINLLCNKIGLEFQDSNFVNYNQLIYDDVYKDKGMTIRDIFDEISKIVAGNLIINDNDKLEVKYINKSILPNNYTQLDYIESNGNQYIDTGIQLNLTDKWEILTELQYTAYTSSRQLNGTTEQGTYFGINKNGYYEMGSTATSSILANLSNKDKVLFELNNNEANLTINDVLGRTRKNINFTDIRNLYIFGANKSNGVQYPSKMKLYSYKIYKNNELILDLVPCYRNSDNESGIYDLVNNNFLTNQGTGTFTYGNTSLDVIDEEYLKDINVRFGEKFGEINSVAILDNDNNLQYLAENSLSIKQNEMTRITITDNLLALNGDTQTIADNILNKLDGLYYYINDFTTTGVCYYDFLDLFNVQINSVNYQCLLLNNEITITQGIQEQIFTEKLEESEISYNEYTTSVMTNKQVQFKINQQDGKIESKVEKNGVISAINQSAEEIQINADKISLEGKEINLTSDKIKIDSNKFSVDEYGNINATGGKLGGWNINNEGLRNDEDFFIKNNGVSNIYAFSDLLILQLILEGTISISAGTPEFKHFDINNDGVLDSTDLLLLRKMILEIE